MGIHRGLVFALIALLLAGCAEISSKYRLAAVELDPPQKELVAGNASTTAQSIAVHQLVQESQRKCAAFLNSLFAETAAANTGLDIAGTITSGLATVFSATAVTHPLSAASTIFGSAKTSISTNYLNTLAIAHIAQAIQASYNVNIIGYINYLATLDPSQIDYFTQRDQIEYYHNQCALAPAEGSIASSVAQGPAPPTKPITAIYTVTRSLGIPDLVRDFVFWFNTSSLRNFASATGNATSGQVAFQMATPLSLSVSATGNLKTSLDSTGTILTISGTAVKGDKITITAAAITKPAAAPAPSAAPPAPAARTAVAAPAPAPAPPPPAVPSGAAIH